MAIMASADELLLTNEKKERKILVYREFEIKESGGDWRFGHLYEKENWAGRGFPYFVLFSLTERKVIRTPAGSDSNTLIIDPGLHFYDFPPTK
jgi:hypothetical protein